MSVMFVGLEIICSIAKTNAYYIYLTLILDLMYNVQVIAKTIWDMELFLIMKLTIFYLIFVLRRQSIQYMFEFESYKSDVFSHEI
jgi:hypothetical protein